MNKKYLGILLITMSLLCFVIVFTNYKKVDNKNINKKTSDNSIDKKEVKNNSSSYKEVVSNKVLGDFIYNVNTKKFKEAYEMMDKEYIKDVDLNYDLFKSVYNYKEAKSLNIKEVFVQSPKRYIVKASLENESGATSKFFTIKQEDDKYTLADIGILSEEVLNLENNIDEVILSISKKFRMANDKMGFLITIKNRSGNPFQLKGDNYSIYAKSDNVIYPTDLITYRYEDYSVLPGIDKQLLITFKAMQIDSIGIMYKDDTRKDIFNFK